VLFQEALRTLRRLDLPEASERDLVAALEVTPREALQLLWAAAAEAGVARDRIVRRGTALLFSYAAGNLADDLIDGDCDYLEPAVRLAPGAQYLLQNLFVATAAEAVAPEALARCGRELALAAAQQQIEVRTTDWTAERYRVVGEAIAGRQWGAYLAFMLAGTTWEGRAGRLGWCAGIAGHVAEDARSKDPRFWSMGAAERGEVLAWALAAARELAGGGMRCLELLGRGLEAELLSIEKSERCAGP
jgi:hypothetical protein